MGSSDANPYVWLASYNCNIDINKFEVQKDFGEAIEYRAEAYLALGRLDDVKAAYLRLVELDDDLAAMLLAAMQAWSGTRSGDTSEAVQAFRAWIAERAALARYVGGDAPDWRA